MSHWKTNCQKSLETPSKIPLIPLNIQSIRKELQEYSQKQMENGCLSDESDSGDEKKDLEQEHEDVSEHADDFSLETSNEIVPCRDAMKTLSREYNFRWPVIFEKEEGLIPLEDTITEHSHRNHKSVDHLTSPLNNNQLRFETIIPKIPIFSRSDTKKSSNRDLPFILHSKINSHRDGYSPIATSKCLFKTPVNKSVAVCKYTTKNSVTPYENLSGQKRLELPLSICSVSEDFTNNRLIVNGIEYVKLNFLGKGGSSEVYQCFSPSQNKTFAIKIVNLTPSNAETCTNEVELLKSLQKCDKIIIMYDYQIKDDSLIVVLEKGDSDLRAIIRQLILENTHIPNYKLIFYWMEMLYAVQQIHMNGVIHTDLKPANFIHTQSGLKLIDFGIAAKVQDNKTFVYKSNQEGTCHYISPEALNIQINSNVNSPNYGKSKHKVHYKSDVWSLGCILYQFIYHKTPFQFVNPLWKKLSLIADPNHKIDYPEADWVSANIIDTVKQCLQYDTRSRPSVNELIEKAENMLKNI